MKWSGDPELPVKFRSQTGALIVLWVGIPLGYKLDGVWYTGMYRPVGFARQRAGKVVAEMFESMSLTDSAEALRRNR